MRYGCSGVRLPEKGWVEGGAVTGKVSSGRHFGSLVRTKGSRIRMVGGKDVSLGGLFNPSLFQSPLSGKRESLSFYYGNLNLL